MRIMIFHKNFSEITTNRYSNLKNLYLESDVIKTADELSYLWDYNTKQLIDATC